MLEQIREDFDSISAITVEAVDAVYQKVKRVDPWICRYRIIDNQLYRYFPKSNSIPKEDTHTEKGIKTLTHLVKLPDMDFLVSYLDAFPLSSPKPEELTAPLMVSGKIRGSLNGILIPDERSIGPWWLGEIRMIKKNRVPWEEKKTSMFWRGGFTKELRRSLVELSLMHPGDLDARFARSPEYSELQEDFEKRGFMGKRCTWIDLLKYRYLPYVDGVMCAWPALQARLFSQSVTFKPDSEEIQWFNRVLKPYIHYIPVQKDLSNLMDQLHWARRNDSLAKEIAENAYAFAKENLMYGDVLKYFLTVLNQYGQIQKIDPLELKTATAQDSNWVNIQYRNNPKRSRVSNSSDL